MDIAAVMYISVGFADVFDVVSTTSHVVVHLRYSASTGTTKGLLVRISIGLPCVGLSGYGRFLIVLGIWSTVAVRNWGSRTGHSSVVRYALAVVVTSAMLLLCYQGSSTNNTELLIFMLVGLVLVVLFLPEALLAVAGGIIVRWAGTVTLFPLACAAEDDFESCGDQEQNTAEYEN